MDVDENIPVWEATVKMLDGTTSYLDTTDDHLEEPWPSAMGQIGLGLQHFVLKKGK